MKNPDLTYEKARELSIRVWKLRVEGKSDMNIYMFLKEQGFPDIRDSCGFCQYFVENKQDGSETKLGKHCSKCPLCWKHPRSESNSKYWSVSRPCSRNFWHWVYWDFLSNEKRSKYWARKMLAEIEATPEHESR